MRERKKKNEVNELATFFSRRRDDDSVVIDAVLLGGKCGKSSFSFESEMMLCKIDRKEK